MSPPPKAKHTHTDTHKHTHIVHLQFSVLLCGSLPLSNQFIMRHRGAYVCSFNTGRMRKSICFRYSETQRGNHTCFGRREAGEEKGEAKKETPCRIM